MSGALRDVAFFDLKPAVGDFERAVLLGWSDQQKWLPARYLYDERGSQLFDEICETDEYYVTRTELSLLEAAGPDIADRAGPGRVVVEYGSGSSAKITRLLRALHAPAGIYNVAEDEPLRRQELANVIAGLEGVAAPAPPEPMQGEVPGILEALMRSQRISNKHFKQTTGWAPQYPSMKEGWPQILSV